MALHGITWHAIARYGMAGQRVALHGIILVVYQSEPFSQRRLPTGVRLGSSLGARGRAQSWPN
eukprot:11212800-Lingulodinium_polyedra.AAC.1